MKTHTFISSIVAALLSAFLLNGVIMAQTPSIKVPPAFTTPQEQASALAGQAVQPGSPEPSSVMAIIYCNKISGLAVVDTEGTIHPITIEGMKPADVMKIMQLVPADRVKSANMGCPGNVAKDTTVL